MLTRVDTALPGPILPLPAVSQRGTSESCFGLEDGSIVDASNGCERWNEATRLTSFPVRIGV